MLKQDGYLQPFVLQVLGILFLVVFAVNWLVTGHQSSLLVGAALTLIGVGSGVGAIVTVRKQIQDDANLHSSKDAPPPERKEVPDEPPEDRQDPGA